MSFRVTLVVSCNGTPPSLKVGPETVPGTLPLQSYAADRKECRFKKGDAGPGGEYN
jgi:hypothetical protein